MSSLNPPCDTNTGLLPKIIFVIGGPGSGKGTLCSSLTEKYNFLHISLGDILRKEAATINSKWGDIIRNNIQEGVVGSKEMTVGLLKATINNLLATSQPKCILIDGFPRSLDRALFFNTEITPPLCVLALECPETILRRRLRSRANISTEQRTDDHDHDHAVVDKRIAAWCSDDTAQVYEHYARSGRLVVVDASGSKLAVLEGAERALERCLELGECRGMYGGRVG